MNRAALLLALLPVFALAQEPREPNALKRLQAVEAKVGTSSELGHLTTNCAIENDSTPIPDSCVGNGTDDTGASSVDTANSPNANEFARFTDADTIEGRTVSETRTDLSLVVGTNVQAFDSDLTTWAGLTPSAFFQTLVDDADAATALATLGALAASSYTAADVLSKLLTVDGASSGLDADLLDGSSSAAFQPVDSDLTSIAALTTTAHGRGLVDDADAAASRSSLSLGTASTSASTDFGPATVDYLVGTANGTLTGEIAVGTSPGGELGGTWASPTLDDSITVDSWTLGSATVGSTASANDNDTSLATTAFVQQEVDDVDLLSDNCVLENDSTPIPDSCVGDGSDAGGGGGAPDTADYLVGTANGSLSAEIVVGTSPGGELGNTWASPTLDDSVGVTDWTLTSPNYAAGSATASSWPNYTAGTLLTTAEDGALEVDADNFYATTDAGNRGTVAVEHWLRAASAQTLTSTTNAQSIFDSPANGRITLETGTYVFEAVLQFTGMSGTSGNAQILLVCGGTCGGYSWYTAGMDTSTLTTIGADLMAYHVTNATAASVVTAQTGTGLRLHMRGSFEVTGAGTFQPQIDLVTAAACTLVEGSYFTLKRIGATSMASVGETD